VYVTVILEEPNEVKKKSDFLELGTLVSVNLCYVFPYVSVFPYLCITCYVFLLGL